MLEIKADIFRCPLTELYYGCASMHTPRVRGGQTYLPPSKDLPLFLEFRAMSNESERMLRFSEAH